MSAGWWLPPALRGVVSQTQPRAIGGATVTFPVLTAAQVAEIAAGLRSAQARLAARPLAEIIDVIDAASLRWLDTGWSVRREAIADIAAITGSSPAMIAESIDLEMRSSRAGHLWRALRRELGDPGALDGFVANAALSGRTRARGPGLIGGIFSANIPALPHLTAMRALAVKSALLGRSSTGEPTFLPRYCQTIFDLDPEIGAALGVIHWPREDAAVEAAFLAEINHLIGYGGAEAEAHYRAAAPPALPVTFHGHRLGLVVLPAESLSALPALADELAADISRFDQHACLSPQVIFVAGSEAAAVAVGSALAESLEGERHRIPPRTLDAGSAAAIQQLRGVAELKCLMGQATLLRPADGSLAWTVVVERVAGVPPSPLDRTITVVPVADWTEAIDRLRPLAGLLQNVAVPAGSPEALYEALAALSVSRICPPGQMATPSMMWHHDGLACLGSLLSWCDIESTPPEELS